MHAQQTQLQYNCGRKRALDSMFVKLILKIHNDQ